MFSRYFPTMQTPRPDAFSCVMRRPVSIFAERRDPIMKQELRSLALLLFGILLVEASRAIGGFDVDERSCLLLLSGIAFGLWGLIRMFYPKE